MSTSIRSLRREGKPLPAGIRTEGGLNSVGASTGFWMQTVDGHTLEASTGRVIGRDVSRDKSLFIYPGHVIYLLDFEIQPVLHTLSIFLMEDAKGGSFPKESVLLTFIEEATANLQDLKKEAEGNSENLFALLYKILQDMVYPQEEGEEAPACDNKWASRVLLLKAHSPGGSYKLSHFASPTTEVAGLFTFVGKGQLLQSQRLAAQDCYQGYLQVNGEVFNNLTIVLVSEEETKKMVEAEKTPHYAWMGMTHSLLQAISTGHRRTGYRTSGSAEPAAVANESEIPF